MDPMQFLNSTDHDEVAMMKLISEEYFDLLDKIQRHQANKIAEAVWGAVK